MATELLTHAKTGVIQMGWPKLYEAVAFKGTRMMTSRQEGR